MNCISKLILFISLVFVQINSSNSFELKLEIPKNLKNSLIEKVKPNINKIIVKHVKNIDLLNFIFI